MQRVMLLIVLCLLVFCCRACWGIGLPPDTRIQIVATADYTNVYNQPESSDAASVTLTVLQVAGVNIAWQPPSDSVAQGADYYIPITITNTGNGVDTFDLSASSSHGWTVSLVYDDNVDGVHQSGETWQITNTALTADGYTRCFVKLHVPANATTGDIVTARATSRFAPVTGCALVNIDVPAPGSLATQLSLSASPTTAIVGQTVTLHGAIVPAIQESISLTFTGPDGANTASCSPGVDGTFTTTFVPDHTGTYTVQADYPGARGHAASTAQVSISVLPKTATSISMQAVPSNPTAGSEVVIWGSITPAMSTTVSLSYQPPTGAATQTDVRTDQYGRFSGNITVSIPGQWTVTGNYAGDATYATCSNALTVQVDPQQAEHAITFTTAPSVLPTMVSSPESAQCSAQASDSLGHGVRYQWSDSGAGGAFTPSAAVASPVYLAAPNQGSENITVALTCTATCAEDDGVAAAVKTELTVTPVNTNAPTVLSVSPQQGSVLNELGAPIVVKFSKSMNQNATAQAISFSPTITGANSAWDDTGLILTINHQPLTAGGSYTCSISTDARDSRGAAIQSRYQWSFSTVAAVRFDPSDIGAAPSSTFATPCVIYSDASQPADVSFKLAVPAGLLIDDALDGGGSLACVKKGADVGDFHANWDSTQREITITAAVPSPSLSVEVIKSIHVGAPVATGKYEITSQDNTILSVQVGNLAPGDFNGDGAVTITDAIRFTQEYVRWQGDPVPTFDADTDDIYDLAPHTQVAWPNWIKIGDHMIDALDAAAFEECWNASHAAVSQSMATASYSPTIRCAFAASAPVSGRIEVVVAKAVNGLFEAAVVIPPGAKFDPALGPSGSLTNVAKAAGAGAVFFSEYDPAAGTVRLAGTVRGTGPYVVATIDLSK